MGLRRRIFATQIATLAIASAGGVLGHVLAQHQQQRIIQTILLQQTTSLERSGDGRTAKPQLAKPQPESQASLAGVQRTLKAELRQANRVAMVFTLLGLGLGILLAGLLNQIILAPLRRLENRMTRISSSTVPGDDPFEVAVVVVEGLEVVEIHHQQRQGLAMALHPPPLRFEAALELAPVAEQGEAVGEVEVLHPGDQDADAIQQGRVAGGQAAHFLRCVGGDLEGIVDRHR